MSGKSNEAMHTSALQLNVPAVAATRPILIIGAPRSGTTLLATMINAHRNIFIANESKLFLDYLPDEDRPANNSAMLVREAESRLLKGSLAASSHSGVATAAVQLREIFAKAAAAEKKKRWGDKTAVGYRRLDALVKAFPDAHYVVVFRDIEEVAASYEKVNPEWGVEGAVVHWIQCWRTVAHYRDKIQLSVVHYTSLLSDAENVLRGLCFVIGESFDPAMLQHHNTERAKTLSETLEFGGVSRPVYRPTKAPSQMHWARRRLVHLARKYVNQMDEHQRELPLPRWYGPLTLFVKVRAAFRVVGRDGLRTGLRRIARTLHVGR